MLDIGGGGGGEGGDADRIVYFYKNTGMYVYSTLGGGGGGRGGDADRIVYFYKNTCMFDIGGGEGLFLQGGTQIV